ncbi:hypothetical protein L6452_14871 [Arctium lappa]|uniref:Uncharacterized protein n=1 Tax=Arctium lappa TaxID=4217 RepID=A0ACB9CM92_ARCLA|nr:hypothetical protein L6452_14871 [Arctium lappa]
MTPWLSRTDHDGFSATLGLLLSSLAAMTVFRWLLEPKKLLDFDRHFCMPHPSSLCHLPCFRLDVPDFLRANSSLQTTRRRHLPPLSIPM